MREPKIYFVCIMSNRSKTLYKGITGNLFNECGGISWELARGLRASTSLTGLCTLKGSRMCANAIEREKQIKGWLRIKKIALIVSVNPAWRDLSLEWFERHPFQPDADAIQRRLSS